MSSRRATLMVQTIAQSVYSPPEVDETSREPLFLPDPENFLTSIGPSSERYQPMALYDGQALAEFAGRACYQAFERKRPETATNKGYLANIQRQSHWSVLEHASVTFYIEGVSRALTHELVRHRHMSYSQLSQRYVDSSDVKFVIPPLVEEMMLELSRNEATDGVVTREGREYSPEEYAVWCLDDMAESIYGAQVAEYEALEEALRTTFPDLKTKQFREAARSVLPNATETKIVVTGNYRSWAEFLTKRDSLAADAEFRRLAGVISRRLSEIAPNVFGDEARALWDHSFAEQRASSI